MDEQRMVDMQHKRSYGIGSQIDWIQLNTRSQTRKKTPYAFVEDGNYGSFCATKTKLCFTDFISKAAASHGNERKKKILSTKLPPRRRLDAALGSPRARAG